MPAAVTAVLATQVFGTTLGTLLLKVALSFAVSSVGRRRPVQK